MLAAFTSLLFFPGILQHGSETFTAATGLTQAPFLERWLLHVGGGYLLSGLLYAAAVLRHDGAAYRSTLRARAVICRVRAVSNYLLAQSRPVECRDDGSP